MKTSNNIKEKLQSSPIETLKIFGVLLKIYSRVL